MRLSIRTKLTIALLGTSLAAILTVAVVSRAFLMNRFDSFVVDRAAEGFLREVSEFYDLWGSWEDARTYDTFFDFVQRTRPNAFQPGGARGGPAGARGPGGAGDPRSATAPRIGERPGPIEGDTQPPRRRDFDLGGSAPPFAVADTEGRAALALGGFDAGEEIDPAYLVDAMPITVRGEVVGFAFSMERPELTAMEVRFLEAMQDGWLRGVGLAMLIALVLGPVLATGLTRPLRDMSEAMSRMESGRIRQTVPVRSSDEVGELATTFNRMSAQLADAYDELETSREELDQHAREMAELSRTDELTGLLNRRAFSERAELLLAQSRRYGHAVCVALVDIDHFKRVNDDFSHAIGDRVLVRTAELLTDALRETDVLARWGGEEFVLAFPETPHGAGTALAERIRAVFERTDWSDLVPGRGVTVSIGLTALGDDESMDAVLARADERLYEAKRQGRNRVVA